MEITGDFIVDSRLISVDNRRLYCLKSWQEKVPEVDARARVSVRVWDPLFDTFLKRNWAQGASNIHRRKHSDDCGAAVGKHALVVFTGTADFKCDACHKNFMASSSTSLNHLVGM